MSSSCYLPEVMGYSLKYPVYPEDLGSDLKKHDLKKSFNKQKSILSSSPADVPDSTHAL